ncbi:MAG: proliferating cell nuclear antigen (pcna) [Candidatus Heimdallarchaeaceae archaeon]
MTFELLLKDEDTKLLGNVISVISGIVSESRLHIDEDGIRIKAFDTTRISMIDFFLKKEAFEKFKIKENTAIGLSLETLNTILKTAKKDERLQLSFDEETKRFQIDLEAKGRKRSFSLMLLELDEEGNIPDAIKIYFDANFAIDAGFFQQVLKDAAMISDYLRIHAKNEEVVFSAASDTKEMNTIVGPESEEMATESFEVANESMAVYSLDFLANFMKGIRSSETVKISFSQDQPLRIINELEGKGHLVYFVAPRIEETEDLEDDEEYDDFSDY